MQAIFLSFCCSKFLKSVVFPGCTRLARNHCHTSSLVSLKPWHQVESSNTHSLSESAWFISGIRCQCFNNLYNTFACHYWGAREERSDCFTRLKTGESSASLCLVLTWLRVWMSAQSQGQKIWASKDGGCITQAVIRFKSQEQVLTRAQETTEHGDWDELLGILLVRHVDLEDLLRPEASRACEGEAGSSSNNNDNASWIRALDQNFEEESKAEGLLSKFLWARAR